MQVCLFFFFWNSHSPKGRKFSLYIFWKARITRGDAIYSKPRRSWLLPSRLAIRSMKRNCIIVAAQERPNLQSLKAQREAFPGDLFTPSWMESLTFYCLKKKERKWVTIQGGLNLKKKAATLEDPRQLISIKQLSSRHWMLFIFVAYLCDLVVLALPLQCGSRTATANERLKCSHI